MTTINTKEFISTMQKLLKVVPKRSSLPILDVVAVRVNDNGTVTMRASTVDEYVDIHLRASSADTDSFMIPDPAHFLKIARQFKADDIEISVDSAAEMSHITFKSGGRTFEYDTGMRYQDFPCKPDIDPVDGEYNYDVNKFAKRFDKVSGCLVIDHTRKMCECVQFADNHMSALNGSVAFISHDPSFIVEREFLVNGQYLSHFVDLVKSGDLVIKVDKKRVAFITENMEYVCPREFCDFLNLHQFIDKKGQDSFKIVPNAVIESVKYLNTWTTKKHEELPPAVWCENIITRKKGDIKMIEEVEDGPKFPIGFDPNNMLNVLPAFTDDYVDVHYSSQIAPLVICGKMDEAIVMPARIGV